MDVNYRGRSTNKPTRDAGFLPTDGYQALAPTICLGYSWTSIHPGRYMEFWSVDGKKKLFTMRHHGDRRGKAEACTAAWLASIEDRRRLPAPEPFTVQVPTISDIIKWPGFSDTKEVKRARAQRMRAANSAVPQSLRWLPPILTMIDNAQDMIFTGLALAWPLVKTIFPRLLGLWGVMLTVNDILNTFT
jgi:hypothetical protein